MELIAKKSIFKATKAAQSTFSVQRENSLPRKIMKKKRHSFF